jgi:hypothetical protein
MPEQCRLSYPSWVQRKAVTLCKRDQKRGGTGNVQEYRLAIHAAVLASEGRDHWTGEPLAWELIGTYDNTEAAARCSTSPRVNGSRTPPTANGWMPPARRGSSAMPWAPTPACCRAAAG